MFPRLANRKDHGLAAAAFFARAPLLPRQQPVFPAPAYRRWRKIRAGHADQHGYSRVAQQLCLAQAKVAGLTLPMWRVIGEWRCHVLGCHRWRHPLARVDLVILEELRVQLLMMLGHLVWLFKE